MMDETASFCLLALPVFASGLALLETVRRLDAAPWRRTWLRGAVLSVLVFLFVGSTAFLAAECYYRFLHDATDAFNYTKTSARWFARHYHRNPALGGLRDTVGYEPEIAPGKRRVTLLGDSFTAGHGIEDVEDRFGNRLRRARPDWEVQVLADIGWSTGDELERLAALVDDGFELDQVVLVYCLNDIDDLIPEWTRESNRIHHDAQRERWLVQNSYFANALHYRWLARREPNVRNYYAFVSDAYRGDAWEEEKVRLEALQARVEAAGAELSVVTFPFLHALGPDYAYRFVHEQMERFLAERGVAHADLLTVFQDLAPERVVVNSLDPHPNELAHELAAEAIERFSSERMRGAPDAGR